MRLGYYFKGWDWTELAEAFNIDCPSHIDTLEVSSYFSRQYPGPLFFTYENYLLTKITEFLRKNGQNKDVIKLCRRFIEALDSYRGLYEECVIAQAIKNVKSDEIFIDMIISHLERLWT